MKKHQAKKALKQKQHNYLQHWSPYEEIKQYNALQDPHAYYYFSNKSVTGHLKDLKKVHALLGQALGNQKNQSQRQKMKQLITSKLEEVKLPTIKNKSPKGSIYKKQHQRSLNRLKKHSRQKSQLPSYRKQESTFSVTQLQRYRNKSTKKKFDKSLNIEKLMTSQAEPTKQSILEKEIKEVEIDQINRQIEKSHRESHAKFLMFIGEKKRKLSMARQEFQGPNNGEAGTGSASGNNANNENANHGGSGSNSNNEKNDNHDSNGATEG